MKSKLKKSLVLFACIIMISACTEIPTISVGPTSDMQISDALNSNNFLNYRLKINHAASGSNSARVSSASITPDDLLFVVYQDEFILNEYARYYFDKMGNDQYDVYFYDKEGNNPSNLGYNYFRSFRPSNPNPLVLPSEEITHYFGVFPYSILSADMFTYRDSKAEFGYYDLNEENKALILHDFFDLDSNDYQLVKFSLLIRNKRIYTFEYQVDLIDLANTTSGQISYSNRVDFIYDNLPLEPPSAPFVNNIQVEPIWVDETVDPVEPDTSSSTESTSSTDSITSEEISPPVSEETSLSEETSVETSSEETTISEEISVETSSEEISSEETSSSDDSSSEPLQVLDYYRLSFLLLKDSERFLGTRPAYSLNEVSIYEGRFTDFDSQTPLLSNEDLSQRYFRLNKLPTVAIRYTIRIVLADTANGLSEYYFYSFIA